MKAIEIPTIATKEQAFDAGRDCAKNSANTTNCHFTLFATKELTKEWQRGYDEDKDKDNG